jgi:hypothetical protein
MGFEGSNPSVSATSFIRRLIFIILRGIMNETPTESPTLRDVVGMRFTAFREWIVSHTPEGKLQESQGGFADSIVNVGAGTKLWMIEQARQHLEKNGELDEETGIKLNSMAEEAADQMRNHGGDPEQLLNKLRQPTE